VERGPGRRALTQLAEVLALVPEHPPSTERARALASCGRLLMLNAAFRKARGLLEEALELAGRLEDHALRASVLNSLAIVYDQLGDRQRAIAAGRGGSGSRPGSGDGSAMLRACINGSQAIGNDGRAGGGTRAWPAGVQAAHRLGLDREAGDQLSQQAAWRLIRLGR
jgi:tetratricopeptide (TPR) repeat protein